MNTKTVLCAVGTRPEAIKMAPVIGKLRQCAWAEPVILCTGQHRELARETLRFFGISPDIDLDVMTHDQGLAHLSARLLETFDDVLDRLKPDLVMAQGDTTSVMTSSLCSFYRRIPFAHVEAGLRTFDCWSPFPEELNRVIAGRVASLHFAPTRSASANLIGEGVSPEHVHVTGNTVVDALLEATTWPVACRYPTQPDRILILVTAHRRENFGDPLIRICEALGAIHDRHPNIELVYPVHPNPNVCDVVSRYLGDRDRIRLIPPVDYPTFAALLKACRFILTDSGGIQEEAPALGKPVLVLREETERPEAVELGVARVVGTDPHRIVAEAERLLQDTEHFERMSKGGSPYGDGRAAERIVGHCAAFLGVSVETKAPIVVRES